MTDTTMTLPLNVASLRGFLPAEPAGTTIDPFRRALDAINKAIKVVNAELEQLTAGEHTHVADILEQAMNGADTHTLVALSHPPDRGTIEGRLAALRAAWQNASTRLSRAVQTDPELRQWRVDTERVTAEWRGIMSIDNESARFSALTTFAAAHRRPE